MNDVLQGDSWQLARELVDESVDCVVTSPPYWGLRDYGVPGQAGLEEHPQLWVDKMVELCELIRPKLKKSGVMFWNIGETYYGGGGVTGRPDDRVDLETGKLSAHPSEEYQKLKNSHKSNWLQPKQLLGLPWRFAIAMQDKGWILRNSIIWDKPNHMPSSVKDRFSNGYEYVFMFVKSRKYWFDLDAVRIPHEGGVPAKFNIRVREVQKGTPEARLGSIASEKEVRDYDEKVMRDSVKNLLDKGQVVHSMHKNRAEGKGEPELNVMGKNCGDVWRITTKPHPFAHFAVFPEELAERCVKSGCPEWVCVKCNKPRERLIDIQSGEGQGKPYDGHRQDGMIFNGRNRQSIHIQKGWSDCGCNAGFSGGVVIDPFMGSGTVAVVAKRLNRQYLGFELSEKYIGIANNRLKGVTDWQTIKDIESGKQKVLKQ